MADIGLIKGNVDLMIEKGAPADDIDKYLAAEGVTADDLKADRSPWQRVKSVVGGAISSTVEAVKGKVDPKFADVPGFQFQGMHNLEDMAKINRGKLVTYDDAAYGDIVKKGLGARVIKTEKDSFGQEVLTYKGDDGKQYQAYLNKPGLDWEDINRAVSSSIPFIAGGGVAGRLAAKAGGGLLARVGAQTAAAPAVSIGADVVAGRMGSEQSPDLGRAGTAAVTSGLFEALAGPVSGLWQRLFSNPRIVKDGRLTEAGRVEAKSMGIDPDVLDGQVAERFAADLGRAADPVEVGSKYRLGEFEIASTKGQRTKSPDLLGTEEEARRGLMGRDAQEVMREFDRRQSQNIEGAVREHVPNLIAPSAPGREAATLGQSIRTATRDVEGNLSTAEGHLWGDVGAAFPTEEGFTSLADRINRSLSASHIRPKPNLGAYPSSNEMLQFLEDYSKDKLKEQTLPLIGKGPTNIFIDDARRYLLNIYRGAERGTADEMAAGAIYRGFNEWIDDLATNAALVGSPDTAAKLTVARGFTREMKELFEPGGATTPTAKKIAAVMDERTSPEEAITALLGAGGVNSAPPKGSFEALTHMKQILTKHGQQEAWDDIRLAYWVRLSQDKQGRVLSPGRLRNNIDAAFENQQSVINLMFTKEEQGVMRRLSTALDDVTFKPPNTSGTSYEAERLRRKYDNKDGVLKTFLQTQSKRELFSKHNVLLSRVYQMLAKKLPVSIFGSKEGAGAAIARRATSDEITTIPPSSFGLGGAVGAEADQ